MVLLAIETSTPMGGVAILSDGNLISELQVRIGPTYSETLLSLIDRLLCISGMAMETIDMYAVAQGPGSFTALRIGISITLGLSIARQKKIISVPSLDGLAYNADPSTHLICPLIDARRNEVYYAFYKRNEAGRLLRLTPYRVDKPERVVQEIQETTILLGDGFERYRDLFQSALAGKALIAPEHLQHPRASAIGILAMQRLHDYPDDAAHDTVAPLYVRPPDATAQ